MSERMLLLVAWTALVSTLGSATAQENPPNIVIFQPDDYPFYWDDSPMEPPGSSGTRDATPNLGNKMCSVQWVMKTRWGKNCNSHDIIFSSWRIISFLSYDSFNYNVYHIIPPYFKIPL